MSAIRDQRGLIATELRNSAGLAIELLDNGWLFAIRHGDVMINLFESQDLGPADLERFFGSEWRHVERRVERRVGMLLLLFHGRQQHVVLKVKELVMERPTGHIMRFGRDLLPRDDILSITAWMSGVFGSQLTIGNTSFNKLLSVCHDPLNVRHSGP